MNTDQRPRATQTSIASRAKAHVATRKRLPDSLKPSRAGWMRKTESFSLKKDQTVVPIVESVESFNVIGRFGDDIRGIERILHDIQWNHCVADLNPVDVFSIRPWISPQNAGGH